LYCDILQEDVESIIGGEEATEIRPYLVILGGGGGLVNGGFCAGSLISPRAVLTAAHCMFDPNNGSFTPVEWVEFNRLDLTAQNEPGAVRITVGPSDSIPHPRYSRGTEDFDVAVVILNEDSRVPAAGAPLDVAGWGATARNDNPIPPGPPTSQDPSPVLKFTTLDYVTNRDCTRDPFLWAPGQITRNMLCAWAAGTATCQGDSGKFLLTIVLILWLFLYLIHSHFMLF
jgi:trypsin